MNTQTATLTGLPLGTLVMTLDGALPVEHLSPGDRVITRWGALRLKDVTVTVADTADMVAVAEGALGHDRPTQPLMLPAGQPVLVRDWRARALFGADAAVVPVSRLVDGQYLRRVTATNVRLFTLDFGCDAVVYADGVETVFVRETVDA